MKGGIIINPIASPVNPANDLPVKGKINQMYFIQKLFISIISFLLSIFFVKFRPYGLIYLYYGFPTQDYASYTLVNNVGATILGDYTWGPITIAGNTLSSSTNYRLLASYANNATAAKNDLYKGTTDFNT